MSNEVVLLVDLSSVAHPIWHMSQSDPDPNHTSIQTVAKVRALSSGQPHVAVCCDKGPYFRVELDPTYKATRVPDENTAVLKHQIELAKETLRADGFPVWEVKGFEADDLIGTATKIALEAGFDVVICSSDKDLLQLVGPHVTAKSLRDGSVIDEAAVVAKFSVRPDQMRDFLSLKGDASDNVVGAKGIGDVKAAALLQKFGSLHDLYTKLMKEEPAALGLKPAEAESLKEFESRWPLVRQLITLRDDVMIPFSEVLAERKPKDTDEFGKEDPKMDAETPEPVAEPAPTPATPATPVAAPAPQALAVREADVVSEVEWSKQLEPRSMTQARDLAKDMFASRLFSAYGSPQAVLTAILMGRELGIQAMASLRAFHIIEGAPRPSAEFLRALVITSGKARFFRCTERSATKATYETQRGDDPMVTLSYTMEEAMASGRVKPGSGYAKDPADLLVARASSKLAKLVYPDVTLGMVAREELED